MGVSESKEKRQQQVLQDQMGISSAQYKVKPEEMHNPQYSIQGGVYSLEKKGTGFLISRNLVVTSAHVVRNFKKLTYYKDIKFFYGRPNKVYDVQTIFIPKDYQQGKSETPENDFVLLKLKDRVPLNTFLPLSFGLQKNSTKIQEINLAGVPQEGWVSPQSSELDNISTLRTELSGLKVPNNLIKDMFKDINFERGQLLYNIPTAQGQSGSPIIAKINDQFMIIGMHKGRIKNQDKIGTLFNPRIIALMKQSCRKENCQPFVCLNVTWDPQWNHNEDTSLAYDIVDAQIIRSHWRSSESMKQIRSYNKKYQLNQQNELRLRFKDFIYSFNQDQIKFGVVIEWSIQKEDRITYSVVHEHSNQVGYIKFNSSNIQRESSSLFVKAGQSVDLLISLDKKKVSFFKNGVNYDIPFSNQHNIIPDIFIFAQILREGDRFTLEEL